MADEQTGAAESKGDKFVRLGTKRVQTALSKIGLIGNLASSSYQYTDEQAERIVAQLRKSVDEVEAKFKRTRQAGGGEESFSL